MRSKPEQLEAQQPGDLHAADALDVHLVQPAALLLEGPTAESKPLAASMRRSAAGLPLHLRVLPHAHVLVLSELSTVPQAACIICCVSMPSADRCAPALFCSMCGGWHAIDKTSLCSISLHLALHMLADSRLQFKNGRADMANAVPPVLLMHVTIQLAANVHCLMPLPWPQMLADPRLQFNFGRPDMADAVPPPRPAEQLEAAKEELLATAQAMGSPMTEEDWQVSLLESDGDSSLQGCEQCAASAASQAAAGCKGDAAGRCPGHGQSPD